MSFEEHLFLGKTADVLVVVLTLTRFFFLARFFRRPLFSAHEGARCGLRNSANENRSWLSVRARSWTIDGQVGSQPGGARICRDDDPDAQRPTRRILVCVLDIQTTERSSIRPSSPRSAPCPAAACQPRKIPVSEGAARGFPGFVTVVTGLAAIRNKTKKGESRSSAREGLYEP